MPQQSNMSNRLPINIKFETSSGDWIAVQVDIDYLLDLEKTPLEIKSQGTIDNTDQMDIVFYTTERVKVGGVWIKFTSPPKYTLYQCSSWTDFPGNLCTDLDKIWKITVDKTAGIRFLMHCNSVEVLDVLLSDSICTDSNWRDHWSRDVEKIYFYPNYDSVSDYYRAAHTSLLQGMRWENHNRTRCDPTTARCQNYWRVLKITCILQ